MWNCTIDFVSGKTQKYVLEDEKEATYIQNKVRNFKRTPEEQSPFFEIKQLKSLINLNNVESLSVKYKQSN